MEFKKALVVGAGYVGSSLAILLSQDLETPDPRTVPTS